MLRRIRHPGDVALLPQGTAAYPNDRILLLRIQKTELCVTPWPADTIRPMAYSPTVQRKSMLCAVAGATETWQSRRAMSGPCRHLVEGPNDAIPT